MKSPNAIGVIELGSLYKGYEVQDAILKMTNIEKLIARSICSGKYLIIVRGEVGDIESCLEQAKITGGFAIINTEMISNVDPLIFPALSGTVSLENEDIEGMLIIETFSVAAVIKAADFAIKEADIIPLRIHTAMAIGGKGLAVFTGNMDALKAAVEPALEYIKNDGTLAGYTLLSQPHPDLLRELI